MAKPTQPKKDIYQVHPLKDGKGQPVFVEMAPGQPVVELPPDRVPKIAVFDLQPAGDGTYRPVARRRELYVTLKEAEELLRVPYHILLRLTRAGFVDWDRPTPNCIRLSLASWFEHQERVRRDPEFWSGKNLERYKEALG